MAQDKNVFLKTWRPFAWIALTTFAVYARILSFDFTFLDDNALILQNHYFLSRLSNIPMAFTGDVFHQAMGGTYYRPLLTLSFMLDARLGGVSPFIYHLTNIFIHIMVSCLLFLLLKKLKYRIEPAFFFSLIFAVHPVLSQAIAWIPGRNDSLLGAFILSAFLCLLNFIQSGKYKWYFLQLFFFLAALFTKELAVMYPLICLLYLYLIAKEKILSKNSVLLMTGWALTIIPWFLIRWAVLKAPVGNAEFNLFKSMAMNLAAIIPYIGKLTLPFNMSVFPLLKDMPGFYGNITIIFLVILLSASKTKRLNFIAFGLFWFLLFLVPSFFQSISSAANFPDHRVYLSAIGFIFIFMEIDFVKNMALNKKKAVTFAILILLFFSAITINHCGNFKDKLSFWKNAAQTSPSSAFNHNNLGAMYYLDNVLDKAKSEWEIALKLNPNERLVHNNLGLIYMNKGLFKKAEAEYLKEIEINPLYDDVRLNLGKLYYMQRRLKDAEKIWLSAIEINPNCLGARTNLARYYYEQKNLPQAIYQCDEILKRGGEAPPELLKALR